MYNATDILAIMAQFSQQGLTNMTIKNGAFELTLGQDAQTAQKVATNVEKVNVTVPTVSPVAQPVVETVVEATKPTVEGKEVQSPIVGTFYESANPDADPFVKVGDHVKKGQVLCIVEAMKLMNEIEAEMDGVIVDICVENEALVEYGQPLFIIK